MKIRGFLMLGLAMTVAGVASAAVFTPAPRDPAPRVSSPIPAPVVAKPVAERRTASAEPAPVRKPAIKVRQAPVPLLMKARPPVDLPNAANAAAVAGQTAIAEPTAKGGEEAKLAENSAKAAIEADGYKGVRVVRQGANGIWHARALRGSAEVMLTVDGQGHVTAD